jgi:hypothetical protein
MGKNAAFYPRLLYPRFPMGEGVYCFIIPSLPERGGGGGGILFYLCPSVHPFKIFFVTFFSVTVDGRNLIIGYKRHIGIPYCCIWL